MSLPRLALSVRQPWAWAIIHAGKDVENRTAGALKFLRHRGPVCIHASLNMTQEFYEQARVMMLNLGITCPAPHELQRGGIIGTVAITGDAHRSLSPWYVGPRCLILCDPQPVNFIPAVGALGFFPWSESAAGAPDAPKRWMLPKPPAAPWEVEQGALL